LINEIAYDYARKRQLQSMIKKHFVVWVLIHCFESVKEKSYHLIQILHGRVDMYCISRRVLSKDYMKESSCPKH
jgi:hypothetical protein